MAEPWGVPVWKSRGEFGRGFKGQRESLDYPVVLNGLRLYNPEIGGFLGWEPMLYSQPTLYIGYPAALAAYSYGSGDPVNFIDPNGAEIVYIHPSLSAAFSLLLQSTGASDNLLALHRSNTKVIIRTASLRKSVRGNPEAGRTVAGNNQIEILIDTDHVLAGLKGRRGDKAALIETALVGDHEMIHAVDLDRLTATQRKDYDGLVADGIDDLRALGIVTSGPDEDLKTPQYIESDTERREHEVEIRNAAAGEDSREARFQRIRDLQNEVQDKVNPW